MSGPRKPFEPEQPTSPEGRRRLLSEHDIEEAARRGALSAIESGGHPQSTVSSTPPMMRWIETNTGRLIWRVLIPHLLVGAMAGFAGWLVRDCQATMQAASQVSPR